MGIQKLADFNTGDNEGFSYFHVNQKRGRRWSAARGFLKPALDRPNLKLLINVLADRLIIEGGRAKGIRFLLDNEPFEARAKGEVILAAGSIGSTQILQRSGIGPHEWLSRSASTSSSTARASAATCRTICSSARSSRCPACAR